MFVGTKKKLENGGGPGSYCSLRVYLGLRWGLCWGLCWGLARERVRGCVEGCVGVCIGWGMRLGNALGAALRSGREMCWGCISLGDVLVGECVGGFGRVIAAC